MGAGKGLIGLPESTLGILLSAGGTQRLQRLVGLSRALAIDLVDRVISAEAFMSEVMAFPASP